MKKYIIINGKNLFFIEAESILKSKAIAENISDHSNEIIIREYESVYLDKLFREKIIDITK